MNRCETSADGEATFIIGGIIREVETKLSDTVHSWSERWHSAIRLGRHFYRGITQDATIVRTYVAQNFENALTTALGFRMALDFALNGFGEFADLFVPFYDGDIEDALSADVFSAETLDFGGLKKNEKNA